MSARTPKDIVAAHYAAAARADVPGMLQDFDPAIRWVEAAGFPYAGTYCGPAAVVQNVLARIGQEWTGFAFHLERLLDSGDTVVAIGSYSGLFRATGRAIDVRTAHVWQVRDGRIIALEQFTDTLLVQRAMQGPGGA